MHALAAWYGNRREAALQELYVRGNSDEALGVPVGSVGSASSSNPCNGARGDEREHAREKRVDTAAATTREIELGQQLEDAEEHNQILENELLKLHEEKERSRRDLIRKTAQAQEDIRQLKNQVREAWEEREDALELLDQSVAKAASLHSRLQTLQETRNGEVAAAASQARQLEGAKQELQTAVQTGESDLAAEKIARLKAEEDNKVLRQQLAALKSEHQDKGGQEDAAREAARAALEAESAARRSLQECVISSTTRVVSECKALGRDALELHALLQAAAHQADAELATLRAARQVAEASRQELTVQLRCLVAQTKDITGQREEMVGGGGGGGIEMLMAEAKAEAAAAQQTTAQLARQLETTQARCDRQFQALQGALSRLAARAAEARTGEPRQPAAAPCANCIANLAFLHGEVDKMNASLAFIAAADAMASVSPRGKAAAGAPEGPGRDGLPASAVLFRGDEGGTLVACSSVLSSKKRRRQAGGDGEDAACAGDASSTKKDKKHEAGAVAGKNEAGHEAGAAPAATGKAPSGSWLGRLFSPSGKK